MGMTAAQIHKAGALELRPAIRIQRPKPTMMVEITKAAAFSMTPDEAKAFDIKEEERRSYVRMDSAKVNITPHFIKAKWFKLVGVRLGNGNELHPKATRCRLSSHAPGDGGEFLARGRDLDRARAAVKQLNAERILEMLDGAGHCGLRCLHQCRGGDETTIFSQRDDCLQLTQRQIGCVGGLHRFILCMKLSMVSVAT